jgi:hypothetical protein
MANINDPESWSGFSEETKMALYRIKELFIDDISQFLENKEIEEE